MGSALPLKGHSDAASVIGTTLTATPTVSPTPITGRNLSVVAAPNVSTGGEPIRFLVNLEQPAQVKLAMFALTGEQVYASTLSGGAGENTLLWDLENQAGSMVASGLYLYKVDINDGTASILKTGKVAVIR